MRISGLATGMDTEQIIKDMMTANRIPLNKINQKKQYLEWQVDDYRSVNRKLKDFYNNIFDNMIMSKNFSHKTVSISSPNDIAIRAKGNMENFTGTIRVEQLATNATFQSKALTNENGEKATATTKLGELTDSTDRFFAIKIKTSDMEEAVEIRMSKDDTIDALVTEISQKTGLRAFFDSHTGQIGFTAKESGEMKVEISGVDEMGDLSSIIGIGDFEGGQNAKFTYNGLTTERSSNTFEIDGIEITLKEANNKDITFNSATDTEKVFENVVKFIDEYNTLIEDLNKQIREPKYRSFPPLSAEQKKEMTEKEIELWEEKAKSGTLRNDSDISSLLSQMRTALMGSVNGQSLSDIGITTSKDYLDRGKLVINEDKLKQAISEDPNKVHQLFANDGSKQTDGKDGFARQLRTIVDATQKTIQKRAGKVGDVNDTFTLGKNLDDMNKQIERFEERLKMTEDRLWRQFTAMERAIQRANAQSASLMNAFGGGGY
ncbi:flagellar hook-associated protein 2 [Sporosarcina sp. USHLN248]|uniref:flagellar hook-associated protein 2 n=1 Tax=Sporosarcina sp. USHLN248 TaxID=3081300 RepID=UPI00301AFA55